MDVVSQYEFLLFYWEVIDFVDHWPFFLPLAAGDDCDCVFQAVYYLHHMASAVLLQHSKKIDKENEKEGSDK